MTLGYSKIKKTILVSLFSVISLSAFSQTFFVRTTGNDGDDGLTALTAKATINAAIAAAPAGSTIDIGPGNFAENVTINKNNITLQGAGSGANGNLAPAAPNALIHTIITGGGVGRGVQISGARTGVTVKDLAIVGYTAEGFFAPANSNNLTIQNLQVNGNCTDASSRGGIFIGGNISNVSITGCAVQNNGPGSQARAIGIWDNFKQNITITNNYVVFIACCGIDLNDGTSSGVNISNNTVIAGAAGGDSGIGVLGMTSGAGPNIIANNNVTVAKRYGIEVKNPAGTGSENETEDGSIVVRNNTITRVDNAPAVLGAEARDLAGIAVFRRSFTPGNPAGYIDVPGGVVIKNNTIDGFSQPNGAATSEGFGIVAEGVRILIKDNSISNCEIAIQRQSGNPSNYVKNNSGDADQNGATNHFNRGNSPFSSGIVLQNNIYAFNGVDDRDFFTGSTFLGGTNYVYNTRQALNYASITLAIETATAGDTLLVGPGEYNELVNIDKSLTIIGSGNTTSIVNYTGAAPVNPTTPSLFKVSAANVTIQDLGFTVNLTTIHSAIHTSGTTSGLKILNNRITATRSAAAGGPSYGTRNAIVINKNYTANGYTFINTGWAGVEIRNNFVEGTTAAQNTFADAFFRSAVDMDLTGTAVIDDNEFTSVNHDVTYRFGNQGKVRITNNLFHGGGVEISEMNAGADSTILMGNTFTSTFGALSAPTAAQIRIKNCDVNQNIIVKNNTVSGKYWLMSIENSMNVIVDNNTFTGANINTTVYPALAGINPKLVTVNTKTIASSIVANNAIGVVFTNNTFNLGTATNATALGFYNHKTPANFGTFVLGSNGNENNFGAGFDNFIYIDDNNGNLSKDGSNVALTGYPEYGGSIAQSTTGYWTLDLDIVNNNFNVGSGLQLPSSMNVAQLTSLENGLYHKNDNSNVGLLTYIFPVLNVNSGLTYTTIAAAVTAANAGDTLALSPAPFAEGTVNINKQLTIRSATNVGVNPNDNSDLSLPNALRVAGEATLTGTILNVVAQNVVIDGLYFTGSSYITTHNHGSIVDIAAGLIIRNCIADNAISFYQNSSGTALQNNITIHDNRITGTLVAAQTGLNILNGLTNSTIYNNYISNFDRGFQINGTGANNIVIRNNYITNTNLVGIAIAGSSLGKIKIENNHFNNNNTTSNADRGAIGLQYTDALSDTLHIRFNTFTSNFNGFRIRNGSEANITSKIIISYNEFLSGATAISVPGAAAGTLLNATGNWFGTNNGPADNNNAGGTGPGIDDDATNSRIAYNPWAGALLDDEVSTEASKLGVQITTQKTYNVAGGTPITLAVGAIQQAISLASNSIKDIVNISNNSPVTLTASSAVNINKSVFVNGNSLNLAQKPIVNGVGNASQQALFYVTSPNVTIQNIEFEVSQSGNALYGIRTGNSGTYTNLRILDNLIEGTNAAFVFGSYGIHAGDASGVPSDSIFIINNTITSNPTGGFGRAIRLWNAHGEVTGNTLAAFYALQSGNAKGGNLKVNNNNGLTGQISFVAFGAGNHEFKNNTISTGGAVLAPNYLQLLEVRSNDNAAANLLIDGNTFTDYQNYAVFIQRSSNITVSNNIFNPLANATGFVSLAWNSKSGTTGIEASITSNNFIATGNTFNGSGAAGGVGIQFADHNSGASPILTGITLGGAGALANSFNASHAKYIQIDGYTGNSQANVLWGAGLPSTTAAVFSPNFDASLNLFGGILPSAMTDIQLYGLEDKIDHAVDIEGAGLISIKANNIYVTQNSFVTPYTTNERIQRAVIKAVDGNNINIQSSLTSYDRLVSVNKDLTFSSDGAVIIDSLSMTAAGKTLSQGIANFTVNSYLNFNGGKIQLGNNDLNIGAAANVGSGSATSYVLTNGTGELIRKGVDANAKLFPVGTAASYAPVTFDDANNTGDDISVSVQEAATLANFTPTLVNVTDFVKLQWNINEAVIGGTNATLTFNWNTADESTPAQFAAANLSIVSRYNGANWVQTPGTIAANTATASGFTSFSPFAVSAIVCDSASYSILYVKSSWTNQAAVDANAGYVSGVLPAIPAGLTFGCNAHATINGALAKLNPGGVIYVYDGTYNEDLVLNSLGVSLRGPRSATTPATIIGQVGGDNSTIRVNANNITIDGFSITRFGNTVADWNNAGLNSAGISVQTVSGATIQYNIIEGNRTGIDINNTQNNIINRNKIDFNRTGILERNNCDGTVISENEITNNWTAGFLSLGNSGGGLSQTLRVINNNVSGNWFAQIEDRAVAGSRIIDLSGNWYGSNIIDVQSVAGGEPGYAAQIPVAYGGTAVPSPTPKMLCGVGVANIDYTPWLNTGTDADVVSFGFQKDTTYLNVNNLSPQFGLVNRLNEAVSMIQENGNINFIAAAYTDDVTINKSITISNSGVTSFGDLTMNGASKELTLNNAFSVDALTMTDGIINTTSINSLTANSASAGNGTSFVNGPLNINITSGLAQTINFPIGKTANGFRGAIFTGDLTANQVLTGEYFANGANNILTISSPILNTWDAAANGYWNISSTNATAVANGIISFNYDANDVPPIGAGSTYVIAKTNPAAATEWISITDNFVTYIPVAPGVATSDIAFNTFSSFALAPAAQCADASMTVVTPTCLEDSTVFGNLTSAVASIVVDRYEWNFGDGSAVLVQNGPFADPLATNNPVAPKHVYPAAGNYTAVLTVVTTSGCTTTDTVEVTIIDAPAITVLNPNITICDNSASTVNFNISNIGSITPWTLTYKINSAGINQIVNGNGPGAFSFTTAALTSGDSILLVSLVNNSSGCADLSLPTINVNYTPVPMAVNFTTTTIDLCEGASLILSVPNSGVDTTYTWSGPNGYSANGSVVTFPNATALTHNGNYTVIPSYLGCNGAVSNAITVTVDAPPTTMAGNDITICAGQLANLAASSSVVTFAWSYVSGPSDLTNLFGTATPSLTEAISATAAVGTHQILLTSTNGVCQTIDDLTITINPALVVPTIAAVNASICAGENLELNVSNAQLGATYTWTTPDGASFTGSSISRASATLAMSGNYSVNVVLNGCSENSAPFAVTINAIPVSNAGTSVTTCFGTASAMNGTASTGTDLWSIVSGPTGTTIAQLLANPSLANSAVLATAPSGSYVLQLSSTENGCSSSSTTNLTINATPNAVISGASSVCENGTAAFNIFVSGLNTGDAWTINYTVNGNPAVLNGTGSGSFVINPTFTLPGATQIVDLVSILNNSTTCSNNTLPEASISVIANPTAVNFTTTTVGLCEGSDLVLSVPSPQAGVTYTWSGPNGYSAIGSTIVYANATAATHNGIYNVTPNNGSCAGAVSNNITVTIDAVPAASAGSDLLVCEGQTASLNASSSSTIFTWSYISGPSNINNLFGTPTPTLVQSLIATASAGTHVIRLTSINGVCQVTDDVTVTINPALAVPVIVASSPSVCEGNNLILSVNNVISGASYTWTSPDGGVFTGSTLTRANASLVMSGNYTVQVAFNGCFENSAPFAATVNVIPTANAGPNVTVCFGAAGAMAGTSSTGIDTWTLVSGPAGVTIGQVLATAGSATSSILATAPVGNYVLTLSSTVNGCTGTDNVNLTINENPNATITGSAAVCDGSAATFNINVSGVGINTPWTLNYTVNGNPLVLNGSGSGNFTVSPIFTLPGANQIIDLVSLTNNTTTCVNSTLGQTSINVIALPAAVNFTTTSVAICNGENLQLSVPNPISGASYTWSGPAGFSASGTVVNYPNATVATHNGNYSVIVSQNGCVSAVSNNITVTVNPIPTVNAGNNQDLCFGFGGVISPTSSGGTAQWSVVSSTSGATIGQILSNPINLVSAVSTNAPVGFHILRVTVTNNGCSSFDDVELSINDIPTATLVGPSEVCTGSNANIVITISGIGTTENWTLNYTVNGTAAVLNGVGSGNFNISPTLTLPGANQIVDLVTITNNATSCNSSTLPEINISVLSIPTLSISISSNGPACEKQMVDIYANLLGGIAQSYNWILNGNSTGYNSPTLTLNTLKEGDIIYLESVVDGGCAGIQTLTSDTITVNPVPTVDAGDDKVIIEGDSVMLSATSTGAVDYLWTPSNGISNDTLLTPKASPKISVDYTITATNEFGCSVSDMVRVDVMNTPGLTYNSFTPDGDGVNDTWIIENMDQYPNAKVSIFNRWGVSVFESTGYLKPWDGTNFLNGEALPVGSYFYVIDLGLGLDLQKGVINIIK